MRSKAPVPPPYRQPAEYFIKSEIRKMFGRHATCRVLTVRKLKPANNEYTRFFRVFVVWVRGTDECLNDGPAVFKVYNDYTIEFCQE